MFSGLRQVLLPGLETIARSEYVCMQALVSLSATELSPRKLLVACNRYIY